VEVVATHNSVVWTEHEVDEGDRHTTQFKAGLYTFRGRQEALARQAAEEEEEEKAKEKEEESKTVCYSERRVPDEPSPLTESAGKDTED